METKLELKLKLYGEPIRTQQLKERITRTLTLSLYLTYQNIFRSEVPCIYLFNV